MSAVLRRQFLLLYIYKGFNLSSMEFVFKGVRSAFKNNLETSKDLNLNKNSLKLPSNINTRVKLP